ncbi:glycosyltransferase family 4 protein [Listeria sp. PSOL-1]|uniref:glycosyltransferase family 4 protein n=1 Tax=Listeria sp. PSOL-1 TaxID=1844999 RepID=UPI0013D4AD96|nr:glycosyltransferase family 4 protein [Listeria sp. PSOL-1]
MKKIMMGVTTPFSLTLLKGQFDYFTKKGYSIHLITSDGPELELEELKAVTVHVVPMKREISVFADFIALLKIIYIYFQVKPDISNVSTPKASLLCSIAAFLSRTKIRIYSIIGLRLETCSGLKRKILYLLEKLMIRISTTCIAVSPSLRETLVAEKLSKASKLQVLASGSYNGIELERLERKEEAVQQVQKELSFTGPVIGFVGRLTRDKGVNELVRSFLILLEEKVNINLLLVGDFEDGDPVDEDVAFQIKNHPAITYTRFVSDPTPYYYTMDTLVLPTYREGFGNVLIEAAYCRIPTITTNATGARDAVIHEETGLIIDIGNVPQLYEAMKNLLDQPALAKSMGERGHQRSKEEFQSIHIWKELEKIYQSS